MTERALVKNANDPEQVQAAAKKERLTRRDELDDLRTVLALPAGRRFLLRLLKQTRVFETIWHGSALIHYNAGQQDIGHFLLAEIRKSDAKVLMEMMVAQYDDEDEKDKPEAGSHG